jgi:hypothetical protein
VVTALLTVLIEVSTRTRNNFKAGCSHYIAKSVLFDSEFGVGGGEQGWDNWCVCGGSSEYFVPYMIMEVDKKYCP